MDIRKILLFLAIMWDLCLIIIFNIAFDMLKMFGVKSVSIYNSTGWLMCRACMGTMGILYYRLAQRVIGQEITDEEQQWGKYRIGEG